MSRKPAHIECTDAGTKLPGRRGVWAAIRALGTFTLVELCVRVPHVSQAAVKEYLAALTKGGFVAAGPMVAGYHKGSGKVRQYSLVRDVGADAPRLRPDGTELPPTAQQNMWMAMKIIGSFNAASLAAHASTGAVPVPEETAERYLRHLAAAGYLSERSGAAGVPVYWLVNDTGGHAPMVQRTKVVFDPNINRVMWHEALEP